MQRKKELLSKMGFTLGKMHKRFSYKDREQLFRQIEIRLANGDKSVELAFYSANSREVKKICSIQELHEMENEINSFLEINGKEIWLISVQKHYLGRIRFDYYTEVESKTVLEIAYYHRFNCFNIGIENESNKIAYQRFETKPFLKSLRLEQSQHTDYEFEKSSEQIHKIIGNLNTQKKFENVEQLLAPQGIKTISFDFILRNDDLHFFDWDTAYNQIETVINTFDPKHTINTAFCCSC